MKKARWIKVDGTEEAVSPKNGKAFTLEELQGFVREGDEDTIDIVILANTGDRMVVNDNGRIIPLAVNENASHLWREEFPIDQYPHNNPNTIHGNVLVSPAELVD